MSLTRLASSKIRIGNNFITGEVDYQASLNGWTSIFTVDLEDYSGKPTISDVFAMTDAQALAWYNDWQANVASKAATITISDTVIA